MSIKLWSVFNDYRNIRNDCKHETINNLFVFYNNLMTSLFKQYNINEDYQWYTKCDVIGKNTIIWTCYEEDTSREVTIVYNISHDEDALKRLSKKFNREMDTIFIAKYHGAIISESIAVKIDESKCSKQDKNNNEYVITRFPQIITIFSLFFLSDMDLYESTIDNIDFSLNKFPDMIKKIQDKPFCEIITQKSDFTTTCYYPDKYTGIIYTTPSNYLQVPEKGTIGEIIHQELIEKANSGNRKAKNCNECVYLNIASCYNQECKEVSGEDFRDLSLDDTLDNVNFAIENIAKSYQDYSTHIKAKGNPISNSE